MTHKIVKGDKDQDLKFAVKDEGDNSAVDLTNATVKFKMAAPGATSCKINGECTITDSANGLCKYKVQEGEADTVDMYYAELEINYSDGKVITAKFDENFEVIADLPAT